MHARMGGGEVVCVCVGGGGWGGESKHPENKGYSRYPEENITFIITYSFHIKRIQLHSIIIYNTYIFCSAIPR